MCNGTLKDKYNYYMCRTVQLYFDIQTNRLVNVGDVNELNHPEIGVGELKCLVFQLR